jgi:hypothetical protein
MDETSHRAHAWNWQHNENDLRTIHGAIENGFVGPEAYESRIDALEGDQESIEFLLGKPEGPPRRWSGWQ